MSHDQHSSKISLTPLSLNADQSTPAHTQPKVEESSSPKKRPYEKPGFIISRAFERQALSCAGCLNQTAAFPAFCAMRS